MELYKTDMSEQELDIVFLNTDVKIGVVYALKNKYSNLILLQDFRLRVIFY